MQIQDSLKSLQKRASWDAFETKFSGDAAALKSTHADLDALIRHAAETPSDIVIALNAVRQPHARSLAELEKHAVLDSHKGWVKNTDAPEEAFNTAKTAYEEASKKFEGFLSGKEKVEGVDVSEELQKAYEAAHAATGKVQGVMNHVLGQLKVEDWKSALKHNTQTMKFWSKDAPKAPKGEIAIRYGAVGAGAALTVDALARGTNKEGDSRSVIARILEGATGIAAVGGGLVAGRAL